MSVLQEAYESLESAQKAPAVAETFSPHKVGSNRDPSGSPPAQRLLQQQSTGFDLASAQSNILSSTQDTFKALVTQLKARVKEQAKVMFEATVEQQGQEAFHVAYHRLQLALLWLNVQATAKETTENGVKQTKLFTTS